MKSLARNLSALTILFTSGHGAADVIYSGFQNITIPATYAGTYIDVDGMTFSTSPVTTPGWDLNPFMGGVYLYNNAAFQPARDGTGGMDTVKNFAAGTTISAAGLNFATGSGGSMDHLGLGAQQFNPGSEGYLGFKLGDNHGWMRVVFTNNAAGARVLDWAYDTSGSGGAIATGNVTSDGSTVTLDSTFGSFTLGSAITGGNSVVKTGAGTVTLAGSNGYAGDTTINVGTLLVNGSLTGSGTVTVAGDAALGGTGSITGPVIVNGGILTPGASIASLATGALTLNNLSTFAYEMNASKPAASAADLQIVNGDLTLSGHIDLALSASMFTPNTTTLSLIQYTGSVLGDGRFFFGETALTEGTVFNDGLNNWKISFASETGGLNFATPIPGSHFITLSNLTAIPEPGSLLGLGCLVGSGAFLRSRRRG